MRPLLWLSIATGVLAVGAGSPAFPRVAGGPAMIFFILFLPLPWIRQ